MVGNTEIMASKRTKEFKKNGAVLKETNLISHGLKRKHIEIDPEFTRITRSTTRKNIQSENQCIEESLMPAKKLAKKSKHQSVSQFNQSPGVVPPIKKVSS